jgi:hypothetical protein
MYNKGCKPARRLPNVTLQGVHSIVWPLTAPQFEAYSCAASLGPATRSSYRARPTFASGAMVSTTK